jgi:hypothetical protein
MIRATSTGDTGNIMWAINYGESKSTGHLERHIRRYHVDEDEPHSHGTVTVFTDKSTYNENYKEAVLAWIVHCLIPFSMVNNKWFRKMIGAASPKAPIFDRDTLHLKMITCLVQMIP